MSVPSSELGPPPPLASECVPPPRNQRVGHSPAREGVGGGPIWTTEEKAYHSVYSVDPVIFWWTLKLIRIPRLLVCLLLRWLFQGLGGCLFYPVVAVFWKHWFYSFIILLDPKSPAAVCRVGCAVFTTFFIRFQTNLSEYGSYSLHIRMFRYIRNHHLFASFAHISFTLFAQIPLQIFNLMQNKYMLSEYSRQSEYSINIFS